MAKRIAVSAVVSPCAPDEVVVPSSGDSSSEGADDVRPVETPLNNVKHTWRCELMHHQPREVEAETEAEAQAAYLKLFGIIHTVHPIQCKKVTS